MPPPIQLAPTVIQRPSVPALRERVAATTKLKGVTVGAGDQLFELHIDRALLATYKPRTEYEWPPKYDKWRAPGQAG